jgi:hypothetical protein
VQNAEIRFDYEGWQVGSTKVESGEKDLDPVYSSSHLCGDETRSSLMAFCAKHGNAVDYRRDAQLKLRFDGVQNVETQ